MSPSTARIQTREEEFANSLSHGAGAALAAIFSPTLIEQALRAGTVHGIAAAVFCVSMILLLSVSAFYHWLPVGRTKDLLRALDHAAIFIFIAGSYTPFLLGPLANAGGPWMLTVVWAIAAIGTLAKCTNRLTHPVLSTGLYLAMGWLSVLLFEPMLQAMPVPGIQLIVGGGILYTIGAIVFHFDDRVRFAHFAWHLLVLGGSGCHFVAVMYYAVP